MGRRKTYPGSIEKRKGAWRVRLCVGGERHRFTLPGANKSEAEQFARGKEAELRQMVGFGLPRPMSFSKLLDRWEEEFIPLKASETRKGYRASAQAFRCYFVIAGKDPRAHTVRQGHVSAYLDWRRGRNPDGTKRREPLSPRSLAKCRATLSSLFAWAQEREIVASNPVQGVRPPKGDEREPVILTSEQYERLLTSCGDRDVLRLFVLVLGETGVRCESEALWLRWQDVDFEAGFITVASESKGGRTKSGKARKVPMTQRLRQALRAHFARYRFASYGTPPASTTWLFHRRVTRRKAVAGERIRSLRDAFNRAAKRAELPSEFRQHDLRHTRATTWLAAGHAIQKVQQALGHSSVLVTQRYMHLVPEDLLSLVESDGLADLRRLADA